MSKPSEIVVLAEDQRHQQFIRRFLYRKGFSNHQIRMQPLPSGRGSGEQWVRDRYPGAVKAYRQRSARARSALVVAIDADTNTVDGRRRQLDQTLIEAQIGERVDREAIVQLIPKRNIETWVLFLTGVDVNEDADYRQIAGVGEAISDSAETFFEVSRGNSPLRPNALPSLSEAIAEIRRL